MRLRNGRFFVGHLFGDFEDPSIFTAKSCKVKDQFCEIFEVLQMQCIYIYINTCTLPGKTYVFVAIVSQIKTTFLEGHVPLGMGHEYKLLLMAVVSTLALTLIESS